MNNAANRREQLRREQEAQARQKRVTRFLGIGAAALALILVGVFAFVLIQGQQARAGAVTPPNATAAKDGLVVSPGNAAEGAPQVAVYLDYQCPYCALFETQFGPKLVELAGAGEISLTQHTMSFMDNNLGNTSSTRAAIAATCSDVSGKHTEYNAAVFAKQPTAETKGVEAYSDTLLRDTLPAQVGITGEALTQFQQCYDQRLTEDFVAGIDKAAYGKNVTGTPTVLVNGKVLDLQTLSTPDALTQQIDALAQG